MTRIVGGEAKGRRLAVPPRGTRPTSDRAREAMFNTLTGLLDLDGARVMDLFAGSGAVGLEALSRGATAACFVESDRAACEVLRRNIETVGLDGAEIRRRPAAAHLVGAPPDEPYDLVFADPPYAFGEAPLAALLSALAAAPWLGPDSVVIVERSARSPEPEWPEPLCSVRSRRYGEGVLWYGRPR